jgi:hypothetical protein
MLIYMDPLTLILSIVSTISILLLKKLFKLRKCKSQCFGHRVIEIESEIDKTVETV